MIKSYKEITGRYLKANKKRTALTIIGIILSVALISSIGFFLKSMQAAQIQDIKNKYGSAHILYKKVDDNLVAKVKNNPNVAQSGIYSVGETLPFNEKFKVREVYGTDEALQLLPYKLKEGRFPKNNTEVAMEKWFLGTVKTGAKLGDKIKILNKEYTLVGILNDSPGSQQAGIGDLLTKGEAPQGKILVVRLKVNKNLQAKVDELAKLADKNDVVENGNLIQMEGQGIIDSQLITLVIIIGIVVVSTIAVIYNSFQISVVERVKQFGLLRAVGATPKQIRNIIFREATFLAAIGVPIGIGLGIVALYGIYYSFSLIAMGEGFAFITPTISMDVIGVSVLVGILSIYASALVPAIFAGRISPLVAISSRNSITKEKIKRSRRKGYLAGKIFGFEGTLAFKNIKRNRKRYRTTVFSIVISVTLFISFKSFMDTSLNVYDDINESDKLHFSIVNADNEAVSKRFIANPMIEKINQLPQVDVAYNVYNPYFFDVVFDKNKELGSVKNLGNIYKDVNYNGEGKTLVAGAVTVYDGKALEAARGYLKEGKIDSNELNKENGVIIVGKNVLFNNKTDKHFFGPLADLKVGDEILLQSNDVENHKSQQKLGFGQGQVKKVKVLGILKSDPFTSNFIDSRNLRMITTEEVARNLSGDTVNPVGLNIKIKDVNLEEQTKANLENIISSAGDLKIINVIDRNRTMTSTMLMVRILLYGFVVVVSLIGCVNIINTLTTNIILRKREFAALKSIGLTQKGLKKMITFEGMLYGITGSIYGSIFGSILSYFLYRGVSNVREQTYMLPYDAIAIAVAGAMLIGYLSVLAPLRRIKKENIIEAVREDF